MSITSLGFVLFALVLFGIYYLIPRRYQWVLLLIASLVFYLAGGIRSAGYILITATTVYFGTVAMQDLLDRQKAWLKAGKGVLTKDEKTAYKKKNRKQRKAILLAVLLVNLGLLCFFKYFHFALEQLNALLRLTGAMEIRDTFRFIIPLGISFYTFQSIGYLLDVYWEKVEAERSFPKVLLFVSFFPQVTQGPISSFPQLTGELFKEHSFSYKNYAWGFQRMIWGFFKKMVVADYFSRWVGMVFENYADYTGITTLIGAFLYSIQIYADFSGYMDIMCGFCETLGIRLTENFDHPYFSRSVAEYWRRWHMSLGAWFKNYLYFPIGMSTWNRKLAKLTRKKCSPHFANTFPATIALLIVWTATGLWHGASWAYISWGLLNGVFIIFAMWMEPVYARWRGALHIQEESRTWKCVQILRTFVLSTFIKVLPEVGTLSQGLGLWRQIFTNHQIPHSLGELLPFLQVTWGGDWIAAMLAVLGTVLMFVFSVIQCRQPVREKFNRLPGILRWCILAAAILVIATFGVQASWGAGGFMYAQF